MSPEDKDVAYVWDMREAAVQIEEFVKDKSLEDYSENKMIRLAIERSLEIIGQAAKKVSDEFKRRYPDIPWPQINGLRNILAHEYGEVKDEKVYLVAIKDIPPLISQLKQILKDHNEL